MPPGSVPQSPQQGGPPVPPPPPPIGARPIGPTPPGTPGTMGPGPPLGPPGAAAAAGVVPGPTPVKPVTPEGPPTAAPGSGGTPGSGGSTASSSSSGSTQRQQFAKWESDEPLGDQATIAAVLYTNQNHPQLKQTHPQWSDRVKQIVKIWKAAPSETRQHYVQLARENRTQSRMNKTVSHFLKVVLLNSLPSVAT